MLFEGHEELFRGLSIYIYDRWDWSNTHPVIRLSFVDLVNRETCLAVTGFSEEPSFRLRKPASSRIANFIAKKFQCKLSCNKKWRV